MGQETVYDLESVNLPRLTGRMLRLLAEMLENPRTRWVLGGRLLKDAGIYHFRATPIDETPTYYPHYPFDGSPAAPDALPPALDSLLARAPVPSSPFTSVRDYANAYRSGQTTPAVVAERIWQAIAGTEQRQPPLRIFIATDQDDLISQAEASTRRWAHGQPLSLFDGVPVAVKDEVDMRPYGTTVGTQFLGKTPATQDSTVAARLRAAGALLIGKTNMHEIGIVPTGLNPHHGFTRNPYHPAHYTGGSSSGSGAAVAAGLCPVAIGADGGGSIRIPAALCGVVGLKSTFGRISEFGAAPLDWTVAHLGPLAATAEDAALCYALIAGPDRRDPHTLSQPAPTLADWDNADLRGITLGIFPPWFEHATTETVAACRQILDGFRDHGAVVREIAIPELNLARVAHVITIASEMLTGMQPYYEQHHRDFGLDVRVNLALTRLFTNQDYIQAQQMRTRAIRHLSAALAQVDAIITPTTALPAPPIPASAWPGGESDLNLLTELMRYAFIANLTGLPAITFPAGYDTRGLPIGCQAMGRPWQEHLLLRLAHAAAQFTPRQKPQVHFDLLG